MKKVLKRYNDYLIVMEGDDFTMYRSDEMLITSMSLNKVDRYWDNYMFMNSK